MSLPRQRRVSIGLMVVAQPASSRAAANGSSRLVLRDAVYGHINTLRFVLGLAQLCHTAQIIRQSRPKPYSKPEGYRYRVASGRRYGKASQRCSILILIHYIFR